MSAVNAVALLAAAGGDYQISRSVRLRSSASANFTRTPASSGNRKTWTWSGWVKRGLINTSSQTLFSAGSFTSGNLTTSISFKTYTPSGLNESIVLYSGVYAGSLEFQFGFANVFRDPSAWYHLVVAFDTTQATSSNRIKVYVNGSQITSSPIGFAGRPTTVSQNYDTAVNNTAIHYIGGMSTQYDGTEFTDGFLTEVNFIDGQALTPSSFGETDTITGVWKPKKYAGTYGTNGFYLNFSDNSSNTATTIGKDNSGNGNNWTPNNISVTAGVTYDSMLDVPTLYADGGNGRGNYCTLNPLSWRFAVAQGTFSEGNLRFTYSGSSSAFAFSTIGVSSGKWYCETTITAVGSSGASVGISDLQAQWGTFTNRFVYNSDGTHTGAGANWATYTTNDVIGIAYDLDANSLSFYKNNALQGSVTLNSGVTYHLELDAVLNSIYSANFGQRPFAYTPPTGFKALNTQNLPAPTILKGNQYFDVSLYTGNATARSITGVGFRPDFVWTKSRSGAESHRLYDAVRGATQSLYSNLTNAEATEAQSLTAFNSDGFSLGTGAPNSNAVTYAAWQWKANGSAVTNTSGSITSQVSAGASQGFSVVTYTGNGTNGATVGHGLGVSPSMIIGKIRSTTGDWYVWQTAMGDNFMRLNTTAAQAGSTANGVYNTGSFTSSVFALGSGSSMNSSGGTFVAYCFSEVAGFSKFGSYTGNGSTDGPFVFCGFRPRWVMIKRTNSAASWYVLDTARGTYNVVNPYLLPNASNSEATDLSWDVLSNGFKLRSTYTEINGSSDTFIYAAFAEHPFKNSLAR